MFLYNKWNVAAILLLILPLFLSWRTGVQANPNIIVFLNDDMGYGDPEVYNAESKIPTPHMNRIASEGMRFTDGHSPNAICSPSRYGLLTGRYAYRSPIKHRWLRKWEKPAIEPERTTLPEMLQQQGYATAMIGKWHLGMEWPTTDGKAPNDSNIDYSKPIKDNPIHHGFDYYFGVDVPNFPPYVFLENDAFLGVPDRMKPNSMFGAAGPMVEGWDLTKILPELAQKSLAWVQNHLDKNPDKPFFLYFANTGPHTPIAPDTSFFGSSEAYRYGDFIHQIDFIIGQLDSVLKKNNSWENTLFIISSDNGSPRRDGQNMSGRPGSVLEYGHDPSTPLKGNKWQIWEGGHRVPFIVRWPKMIKAGSKSDALIGLTDIYATVANIVGAPLEKNMAEDSYNMLPVLLGDNVQVPIRKDMVNQDTRGAFSIRQGVWKFIPGQGLYNLERDLDESDDVSNLYPEIVDELSLLLDQYITDDRSVPWPRTDKSTGFQLP